jgi:hypothetical protein
VSERGFHHRLRATLDRPAPTRANVRRSRGLRHPQFFTSRHHTVTAPDAVSRRDESWLAEGALSIFAAPRNPFGHPDRSGSADVIRCVDAVRLLHDRTAADEADPGYQPLPRHDGLVGKGSRPEARGHQGSASSSSTDWNGHWCCQVARECETPAFEPRDVPFPSARHKAFLRFAAKQPSRD